MSTNRVIASTKRERNRNVDTAHEVQVIAVTGGKGGVGKSNLSLNLAIALSRLNNEVLLLDADLGMANIDVLLGIHPERNLSHVLKGQCELEDVMLQGPAGINIIPASSGCQEIVNLAPRDYAGVISAFDNLSKQLDVMIIDTAAGISDMVTSVVKASQEIIVVVTNEPASITDAYSLIKSLNSEHGVNRFHVVANMVDKPIEGRDIFDRLQKACLHSLEVALEYLGAIPHDEMLRKAVQKQNAVLEMFPNTKASTAINNIANKVHGWPIRFDVSSQTSFFFERLVQGANNVWNN